LPNSPNNFYSNLTPNSPNRVGIRNSTDYSPFGVELDGRTVSNYGYRFGYQGSEKDNEFKGEGNSYTTEFRQLDPRLGRWLSVDPLEFKFPWQSTYTALDNNPILLVDYLGSETEVVKEKEEPIKVQETRAVTVRGYKHQHKGQSWNRFMGGIRATFGAVEAFAGSTMIALTPYNPLGYILLGHGVDNASAGISQVVSGNKTDSFTHKGIKEASKLAGVGEKKAEMLATIGDASIGVGGTIAASVLRNLAKVAPAISPAIEGYNFTKSAAAHMDEASRVVPVQILDEIIKGPMQVIKDPQGSNALMHYSQMFKNSKLYNVEVLYDKGTNMIMHFKYTQKAIGPLKAIPK
jgi:RHS repeat-associated protein